MEFLNIENNLWYYWKNYTPDSYKNANQEVKRLMQKMDNFDKHNLNKVGNRLEQLFLIVENLRLQLPQNLIYGVEPLRAIKKFMELQRELVLINTTYDKYKRYSNKCLQKNHRQCQFDGLIDDVTNDENGVIAIMSRIQDILYNGTDCFLNDLDQVGNSIFVNG